jgi:hypothetical protein
MKVTFLVITTFIVFACAEKPTLCECMKKSVDINKELTACKNDEKKIREINEQTETKMEGCNGLLEGLSASEKDEMSQEAKNCEFYPEFLQLFEVTNSPQLTNSSTKF